MVLAVIRGQQRGKALHAVDSLHAPFQQLHAVGVSCYGFTQCPANANVFRHTPEQVGCIGGLLRQNAVAEHQTAALMDLERAVDAGNIVILRLSELRHPVSYAFPAVVLLVQAGVVWLHDGALIDAQFINAADMFPVNGFFQPAPIVDQHDDKSAAVEPRPLDSGSGLLIPFEIIQRLIDKSIHLVAFQIQVKAVLQRFLGRRINDFGEQAIAFIQPCELHIRDDRLPLKLVRLGVVLLGSILVQEVHIAILTMRTHSAVLPPEDFTATLIQTPSLGFIFRYVHCIHLFSYVISERISNVLSL